MVQILFQVICAPKKHGCKPRILHGAIFSYGVVRFGAFLPHRSATYDCAFNETAPRRAAHRRILEKKSRIRTGRTAPHRTIQNFKSAPNRTVRLPQERQTVGMSGGLGGFRGPLSVPPTNPSNCTSPTPRQAIVYRMCRCGQEYLVGLGFL